MEGIPFTPQGARLISKHFQFLIGEELKDENNDYGPIECVTISPYDDLNKWIFLEFYNELRSVEDALKHYSSPYYDVVLLTTRKTDNKAICIDIRSYLKENDFPFQEYVDTEKSRLL